MNVDELTQFVHSAEETDSLSIFQVRLLLAQKDNHLQVAAAYGNELIQKISALESEKGILSERITARNMEVEELYVNMEKIREHLQHQESKGKNTNEERSRTEEESIEVKAMRQKYEVVDEQLKDVTNTNATLMADIERKNTLLSRFKTVEKELKQHRQENEALHIKNEELKNQIEQGNTEKIELLKEIRIAREEERLSYARVDTLEKEISSFKQATTSKDLPLLAKIEKLEADIKEAEGLLEEQNTKMNELEWERKNLEGVVTQTMIENEELQKEKAENLRCLDDVRNSLSKLHEENEEQTVGLLGENLFNLEQELKVRIDTEKEGKDKKEQVLSSNVPSGHTEAPQMVVPENAKEYFFLAVTAIKIHYCISTAPEYKKLFQLDAAALYEELLNTFVPFHMWYEWVTNKFDKILSDHMEKEKQKRIEEQEGPKQQPEQVANAEPDTFRSKFLRFMKR